MFFHRSFAAALALCAGLAQASMGLGELPATVDRGPVTLYYPSQAEARPVHRGMFDFDLAVEAAPVRGNGRLVVISHGSGGSPWVHVNLARSLVDAGYVVAMPAHKGDNYRDDGNPGPDSWTMRPAEISQAIDAVGADARFAPLLDLQRVGVYGFSAGGHTALSMAGGRWSPGNFRRHCEANLEQDFQSCVGLFTRLTGGPFDGLKKWVARRVIDWRFDDDRLREHHDPRVAAVVAAMPSSADFDMASFASLQAPLGLVTGGQDRWLVPRFHSERVLQACPACERVAEMPAAGHGAMLSPLPPGLGGLLGDLLNDPPGFDRGQLADVDRRITAFFQRHLSP